MWSVIRHEIGVDERPHQAATYLLRQTDIDRPPVPVELLASRLDITVIRRNPLIVDGVKLAGVLQATRTDATIWVNGDDQPVRQRFTIAHELGHLLLHSIGTQYRDHAFGPSTDWKENQANAFAAALLVPLWMLEPIVISSRRSKKDLADLFEVSIPAMDIQLRKLL